MRTLAYAGAMFLAMFTSLWGVIQGPVGDVLPYAAAAGALGVIIKAMSFLNTYQDRIVNGLDAQLIQTRADFEVAKTEHRSEVETIRAECRRDIEQIRTDARHEVEARDHYITYLLGQIADVRRQAGLPDRRLPPPPISSMLGDDDSIPPAPSGS